jgi:hypothetical protein
MLTTSAAAATGDVLANCNFESAGTTTQVLNGCGFATLNQSTGSIASGEGWNGSKCYKGYYPANTSDLDSARFWTAIGNKKEITIVYYERFSIPTQSNYGWNFKGVRAKNGDADYMGGTVSQWSRDGGDSWFLYGHLGSATLTTTSAVNRVNTYAGYCTSTGGSTYSCGNQLAVEFAPALQFGVSWRKVRFYLKAPTSVTARDGVAKLWIDETLVFTVTNIAGNSSMLPYFTYVDFRPSDDFFNGYPKPALYHYYDDITIYEGLVPPQGTYSAPSQPQAPAVPQGIRILSPVVN